MAQRHSTIFSVLAFFLLASFFFFPLEASAQFGLPGLGNLEAPDAGGLKPTIAFEITPSSPSPGQQVIVRAKSFSIDLTRSTVSWKVNGKVVQQGTGITEITTTAPTNGRLLVISVLAVDEQGLSGGAETVLGAGDVDIIWQANSYTPPLYRGKALPSYDSTITLNAVADIRNTSGARISSNSLNFTWRLNGQVLGASSGLGKRVLTIPGSKIYRGADVEVIVSTQSNAVSARATFSAPSVTPQVVLYEQDPLLGIRFERALTGSITLKNKEMAVVGVPYFFSAARRGDSKLDWQWTLNNQEIVNRSGDKSVLTFRHTNEEGGLAQINVAVQNTTEIFQAANAALGILFGLTDEQLGAFNQPL